MTVQPTSRAQEATAALVKLELDLQISRKLEELAAFNRRKPAIQSNRSSEVKSYL